MNIVLIGFQGVGKTTCGKLLAEMLDASHIDSDALLVEAHAAKSVRELYHTLGEKRFYSEQKKFLHLLQEKKNCVFSLGGGFVLIEDAQNCIAPLGQIVHLSVTFETFCQNEGRFLQGSFLEKKSLQEHYTKRNALYEMLCHHQIPVDQLSAQEVAKQIMQEVVCGK